MGNRLEPAIHQRMVHGVCVMAIGLAGLGCGGGSKHTAPVTLQLEPFSALKGQVGEHFQSTLRASGGSAPYQFTMVAGSLPPGLILAKEGLISGIPTTAGNFTFSVSALDAQGHSDQSSGAVEIADRLRFEVLPALRLWMGQSYASALHASGGRGPYVYALTSGPLPEGIQLQSQGLLVGTPTRSGDYPFTLQVTDSAGYAASTSGTFAVLQGLAFALEPASLAVYQGETATFSVRMTGSTSGTSFVWEKNGVPIPGENTADLRLRGVSLLDDGTIITCTLVRGNEILRSRSAMLQVKAGAPPQITRFINRSTTRTIRYFEGDTLHFTAMTQGTPPISHQWFRGNQPIPGATQDTLVYPNLQSGDNHVPFYVRASNAFGFVMESLHPGYIYPRGTILFEMQPGDAAATLGGSARFMCEAVSDLPMTYQWSKEGKDIPGATQPFLELKNLQSSAAGIYACKVKSGDRTVESKGASLSFAPFALGTYLSVMRLPVGAQDFPVGFNVSRAILQPGETAILSFEGLPMGVRFGAGDKDVEVPQILGDLGLGTNWNVDANAQPGSYVIQARLRTRSHVHTLAVPLEVQAGFALEMIPNRRIPSSAPEIALPVRINRHPAFTPPVQVVLGWNPTLDPRITSTWDATKVTGPQTYLRFLPSAGSWPSGPVLFQAWISASAPWPYWPQGTAPWIGVGSLSLDLPQSLTLRPGTATTCIAAVGRALDEGTVTLSASSPQPGLLLDLPAEGRFVDREGLLRLQADDTATPGTYTLPITAEGSTSSASRNLTIRVPAAGAPADRWLHRVELGQTLVKQNLKLVAGKAAWVRATVMADRPGVASPKVRLTGTLGGQTLGPLILTGPAQLSFQEEAPTPSNAFTVKLPAPWVKPGLSLRLALDADPAHPDAFPENDVLEMAVQVGSSPVIPVTWLPIKLNGQVAPAADWDASVVDAWPVAAVQNKTHVPLVVEGSLSNAGDWERLLSQVEAIRLVEDPGRIYAGMIPLAQDTGSVGGMAFRHGKDLLSLADSVPLIHEFGHLFGLGHAPCGSVNAFTVDPFYPYPSGRSGTWGIHLHDGSLIAPGNTFDVMSYCWPQWPTEWSYERTQMFFETNGMGLPSAGPTGREEEQFLLSGVVEEGRISLNPIHRVLMPSSPPMPGPHTLQLETVHGPTQISFQASPMSHRGDVHGFAFTIPASVGAVKRPGTPSASERPAAPRIETEEGRIRLRWDARQSPSAMVVHVSPEGRTVLALHARSGDLELSLEGLHSGGHLEVSLSDGIRPERFTLGKPERR